MTQIRTFSDLINKLESVKDDVLANDVAEVAKKTMQDNVQKHVYDAYTPSVYIRTGDLKRDVEAFVDKDTLVLYNIRTAMETDGIGKNYLKYIPQVIETGIGYSTPYIDERIGARPFIRYTHEELKNGKFKESVKDGFKKRGYKVV